MAIAFTLLMACSARTSGADRAATDVTSSFYGAPWSADSLANLEVGRFGGSSVSYRFRAAYSGTVEAVRIFLVFRTVCEGCYAKGNGGQVLLQLHPDDGSATHLPSPQVLSSSLVTDPMKEWNRLFPLDKPAPLRAGELYHLVFTNPSPDPANNYVSVDNLHNARRMPNMQPAVSDTDFAVLWKPKPGAPWEVNYGHTPIFALIYQDGRRQGQGYIDVRGAAPREISGARRASEVFTVTGPDRTVSFVSVRVKKTGKPGDLRFTLAQEKGPVLESGAIDCGSVADGRPAWVTYRFAQKRTLKSKQTYRLSLSAPPGDAYQVFIIQKGTKYGFASPGVFSDGRYQYESGAGWQDALAHPDLDMQFYFGS